MISCILATLNLWF